MDRWGGPQQLIGFGSPCGWAVRFFAALVRFQPDPLLPERRFGPRPDQSRGAYSRAGLTATCAMRPATKRNQAHGSAWWFFSLSEHGGSSMSGVVSAPVGNLSVSRKAGQSVLLFVTNPDGTQTKIDIQCVQGSNGKTRLRFSAPMNVKILRAEIAHHDSATVQ